MSHNKIRYFNCN